MLVGFFFFMETGPGEREGPKSSEDSEGSKAAAGCIPAGEPMASIGPSGPLCQGLWPQE